MTNLPKPLKKWGIYLPLFLIILVLIVVNIKSPQEPEAPVYTVNQNLGSVTILLKDPIAGIYPETSSNIKSSVLNFNIFDGLANLRNGKLEKGVASEWKNLSPTSWEYTINTNAHFSDGKPVSPSDVIFSLLEAEKNNWPLPISINSISSVFETEGKIIVQTIYPVPNLPVLLAQVPILSKDQFTNKQKLAFPIGTGPFKILSFDNQKDGERVKNQTLVLEANNSYFGTTSKVQKLIYRFINQDDLKKLSKQELEKNFQIIEPGAIDKAIAKSLENENYTRTQISGNQVSTLIINPNPNAQKYIINSNNPLSQAKVRKAIALSLSTAQIISAGNIDARPANQLVTPLVFGYNPQIHRIGLNHAEASRLMSEAGIGKGFAISITSPENKLSQAESIAAQLKELDLDVSIIKITPDTAAGIIKNNDFAIYLGDWISDSYDSTSLFTQALVSSGSQNYNHFSDPRIDSKVVDLNKTFNPETREKVFGDLMNLAMDDMIWIPIMEETTPVLVKDSVDLTFSQPFIAGIDLSGK